MEEGEEQVWKRRRLDAAAEEEPRHMCLPASLCLQPSSNVQISMPIQHNNV